MRKIIALFLVIVTIFSMNGCMSKADIAKKASLESKAEMEIMSLLNNETNEACRIISSTANFGVDFSSGYWIGDYVTVNVMVGIKLVKFKYYESGEIYSDMYYQQVEKEIREDLKKHAIFKDADGIELKTSEKAGLLASNMIPHGIKTYKDLDFKTLTVDARYVDKEIAQPTPEQLESFFGEFPNVQLNLYRLNHQHSIGNDNVTDIITCNCVENEDGSVDFVVKSSNITKASYDNIEISFDGSFVSATIKSATSPTIENENANFQYTKEAYELDVKFTDELEMDKISGYKFENVINRPNGGGVVRYTTENIATIRLDFTSDYDGKYVYSTTTKTMTQIKKNGLETHASIVVDLTNHTETLLIYEDTKSK